jgi:hypothetical protein
MQKVSLFKKNLLYVDYDIFLCNNRNDLERLRQELYTHFLKFEPKMSVVSGNESSKMVAMYFPPTIELHAFHKLVII